jgi:hypothetical protein
VAAPYASGMMDVANERGILDDVHKDLMGLQVCAIHRILQCGMLERLTIRGVGSAGNVADYIM